MGERGEWAAKCRRAEELGYDAIAVSDHLGDGRTGPMPALAAAAAVTERIRVLPFVLNVPFYNPALLARDVYTVVQVSGDRFELGLGSGHMKAEFDEAGLPWWPARERTAFLDHTIAELRRLLGDELPPLLVAGNSDGVLDIAAREADIVGFAGLRQVPGEPPGTFTLVSAEALDERVRFVRDRAGDPEFNMLVQHVAVTGTPEEELASWQERVPQLNLTREELLAAPQFLVGTVDDIVERLYERRDRYGFSYVTVFEPAMEAFAEVIRVVSV